ncbi:hypothetical protein M405DRAFT_890338 [Rhizopogon salebrosus TDB-379]|nr:hypothetical protein M405DRAFT_890338 [Rhizopogon salebrosus TDB-379]
MEETRRSALNELRVVRRAMWMVNVQKEARASTLLVSSSTGTIHSALDGTRWRRARSPRIAAPTAQQNQADSQDTRRFAIVCMRANDAQDMSLLRSWTVVMPPGRVIPAPNQLRGPCTYITVQIRSSQHWSHTRKDYASADEVTAEEDEGIFGRGINGPKWRGSTTRMKRTPPASGNVTICGIGHSAFSGESAPRLFDCLRHTLPAGRHQPRPAHRIAPCLPSDEQRRTDIHATCFSATFHVVILSPETFVLTVGNGAGEVFLRGETAGTAGNRPIRDEQVVADGRLWRVADSPGKSRVTVHSADLIQTGQIPNFLRKHIPQTSAEPAAVCQGNF